MALANVRKRMAARNGKPVSNGIGASLREAGPGIVAHFEMVDGNEVVGSVGSVSGDSADLGDGGRVDLNGVRRVRIEFSAAA
jgi:hypothetical protein